MKDLKIIFLGTPDFVIPVLEALIEHFTVVAVITTPDALAGRKQVLAPSPVKLAAQKHNIPIFTPQKINSHYVDPWFLTQLSQLNPDIGVVASYGKLIPQELIDLPRNGSLNIHPSKLPQFRGPTPVPASILAGIKESAVTIIQMDSQMDHGPILAQQAFKIESGDTSQSVLNKAFKQGADLLVPTIQKYISGQIFAVPQDDTEATLCHLLTKDSGYFDINNPPTPEILDRMIRAYFPWPTVWTKWSPSSDPRRSEGSKIIKFLPGNRIQMEGKKPVDLKDFLNGHPNFPLKILLS